MILAAVLGLGIILGGGDQEKGSRSLFPHFDDWFSRYRSGKMAFVSGRGMGMRGEDTAGLLFDNFGPFGEITQVLGELLSADSLAAADPLLRVASFRFDPQPQKEREKFPLQQPWTVREKATEALGKFRNPDVIHWLSAEVLLLKAKFNPTERSAAARALGEARNPSALLGLLSAISDESAEVRAAAVEAAGRIGGPTAIAALVRKLDDENALVRMHCLDFLAAQFRKKENPISPAERERVLASASSRLADPDWKVRMEAAAFFVSFAEPRAIPALISALRSEIQRLASGTGRKRAQYLLVEALFKTGAYVSKPLDPESWQKWWEDHKDKLSSARSQSRPDWAAAGLPYYFGIPVRSDRMVFLLDVSVSMEEICEKVTITGSEGPVLSSSKRQSKLEWASSELISSLKKLPKTDRFNVILFDGQLDPLFPNALPANSSNLSRAIGKLHNLTGGPGTNIYGALEASMGTKEIEGNRDFEADADTIFLLSDGDPSAGPLVDPDSILSAVRSANRNGLFVIHTIFFGAQPSRAFDFMETLARENGGEFRWAISK